MKAEALFDAIGKIDDRYLEECTHTTPRRVFPWKSWSAMAACFAVLLMLTPKTARVVPSPSGTSSAAPNEVTSAPSKPAVRLHVNPLTGLTAFDIDVQFTYYDKLPEHVWRQVADGFYAQVGIAYDDFSARIPQALRDGCSFYSRSTRGYKNGALDKQYRLHDYIFDCRAEDGTEALISLSASEPPLRCYSLGGDAPDLSQIGDTPLTVYGNELMYIAYFSHGGVYYDVETRNMDLDALEGLLTSLLY